MADAIVGSLVESLISLLKTEFNEIKGVRKDVKKLENTLSAIQAVLEDAEEEQIKNKSITDWLRKLKDSTYDAEDALDAWSLEIQQRELDFANMGCSSKVREGQRRRLAPHFSCWTKKKKMFQFVVKSSALNPNECGDY